MHDLEDRGGMHMAGRKSARVLELLGSRRVDVSEEVGNRY